MLLNLLEDCSLRSQPLSLRTGAKNINAIYIKLTQAGMPWWHGGQNYPRQIQRWGRFPGFQSSLANTDFFLGSQATDHLPPVRSKQKLMPPPGNMSRCTAELPSSPAPHPLVLIWTSHQPAPLTLPSLKTVGFVPFAVSLKNTAPNFTIFFTSTVITDPESMSEKKGEPGPCHAVFVGTWQTVGQE